MSNEIIDLTDDSDAQEFRKRKKGEDSDNSIIFSLDVSDESPQLDHRKFINLNKSPELILNISASKMAPNTRLVAEADELKQLLSWEPENLPSTSSKKAFSIAKQKKAKRNKQTRKSIDALLDELEEGLPQNSKEWKEDAESMMNNFVEAIAQAERENWGAETTTTIISEEVTEKIKDVLKEPAKKKRKRTKEEIDQEKVGF